MNSQVTIIGGGVTGALLTLLLGKAGISVNLIDRGRPSIQLGDLHTGRTASLNLFSIETFRNAGIWNLIEPKAKLFDEIVVWDSEGSSSVNFKGAEISRSELGYIVHNNVILNALYSELAGIEEINIIRNLSEPFVTSQIIEIFKQEINYLSLKDMGFKEGIDATSISDTKPYLSSRKKIYYSPKKSVFNLVAGDSKFEIEFCKYLDSFEDVIGFFKNDIQLKQYIEYVKHDGKIGSYYPDFFIKLQNGERWVVETKGAENLNDPLKYKRLETWCEDATKSQNISWNCFYLRQEQWNGLKIKPDRFLDLVNLLDN